ncbi:MAG: biotin--[acetyl-CoA-carboxylase] ligase [Pseudomonadota bacterium]|nr:biotin--[acetyl-CoA-carboxylase] ligase [Pseudomonadota bacterium]
MRRSIELLALLHDGAEHSGADLAHRLGISRAAIWNHIDRLRREGIEVRATRGRGYVLEGGFEVLDTAEIHRRLQQLNCKGVTALEAVVVTDSTNERLLAALPNDNIHGRVLLAEYQTAGRGRHGDQWIAPPGSGLCMSLGWCFDSPPTTFSALSLVVGLAVVSTLAEQGICRAMLKWPNDIVRDGCKLGGILIEMRSESGGPCTTVIGLGINIRLSQLARGRIEQPSADLESAAGHAISRNALAAALLNSLCAKLSLFGRQGFAGFWPEWRQFDVLADEPVRLDLAERVVEGIARGVDENGALIIEHSGRREKFMSGHLRQG